jgi:hypothetical protein
MAQNFTVLIITVTTQPEGGWVVSDDSGSGVPDAHAPDLKELRFEVQDRAEWQRECTFPEDGTEWTTIVLQDGEDVSNKFARELRA